MTIPSSPVGGGTGALTVSVLANTGITFSGGIYGATGNYEALLGGIDTDGDNIADFLDLDSDGDGISDILEAGGTDSDGDGEVDYGTAGDPSTMTDADGDGLADAVDNIDSGSGGGEVTSGTPLPHPDSDSDDIKDVLDIDSDNDGITDNVEAQTTAGYTAPAGSDTDGDGIDNSYDGDDKATTGIGSGTGTALSPTDTDSDATADYLDSDSDNDGVNDVVEGHDTNGDGVVDGSDSPNTNTGLAGGSTDADSDGLLDGFDNNTSSWDATNGSLTAESHPDVQAGTSEQDWREGPDWDGDGIVDIYDLDDDNDGILDTEECGTGAIDFSSLNFTGQTVTLTNGYTVSVDGALTAVPSSSASGNSNGDLRLSDGSNALPDPPDYSVGDSYQLDFLSPIYVVISNMTVGIAGFDGLSASGDEWRVTAAGGFYVNDPDGQLSIQSVGADFVEFRPVLGTGIAPGAGTWSIVSVNAVSSCTLQASGNPASVVNVSISCGDTDGDGFADHLDLDSDGDGCSDAEEGAGSFTISSGQIQNDTLTGGVDADGVPAIATASGQGVGDAQNSGTASCACPNASYVDTDADGIDNTCDLDDDNDGILDAAETDCSGSFIALASTFSSSTAVSGNITDLWSYGGINPVFAYALVGSNPGTTPAWSSGVSIQNSGALQPDGDYLNLQPINTDIDLGDYARYTIDFGGTVSDLELKIGGLDNDDAIEVYAYHAGIGQSVTITDINLGINGTISGNRVESVASSSNAPNNAVQLQFPNPVDSIEIRSGKTTGSIHTSNTNTLQFYELRYCSHPDTDADGIPDYLDLDSDNDGIPDLVEAGGTDSDGDGEVDYGTAGDPSTMTDADSDGLYDTVDDQDSGSGGGEVTSGTPLAYPDSDSDGVKDVLDIDSDNDGITDNVESQTTSGYTAPSGSDTDGDGIDNAYDGDDNTTTGIGGGTGTAISPTNTDSDATADYLDSDSDDDGVNDVVEGHDTNGDGTVDGSDSPNANTGLAGGNTDADLDGLLDGFDNNTSSWDATNGSLTAESHPDVQAGTSEQDWREGPDWDGDGVADRYDLDDDNDGILDSDEGCSEETYVSDVWNSNTLVLADNSGGIDNTYISSISAPGTFGSGIDAVNTNLGGSDDFPEDVSSATSSSMAIYGVDQSSLTNAINGDDYFEMEFTTAASWSGSVELSILRYAQYYLAGTSTEIGGQYSYGLYISDDNFASSTQLKGSGINGKAGVDEENYSSTFTGADFYFYEVDISYSLAPATTYKLRYYLFGDSDGKVNLDDLSFDVVHCTDNDRDGVPNSLDLDSDGDGIPDLVEAGGTDSNGNGEVDNSTDTDGDGLVDTYDNNDSDGPDVSGCSLGSDCNLVASTSVLLDTNNDGTNDNDRDEDSDGYANYVDIDSDADGIVDNNEAQGTSAYVAPSGTDTDGDGIDDAYDVDCSPCGGVTGVQISPVNTDGEADNPDYLDTDSDEDGESDTSEAYDSDDDGSPNTTPAGTDTDGDGLDDNFDSNVLSSAASTNANDNGETPAGFPNTDIVGGEPNWREATAGGAAAPIELLSFSAYSLPNGTVKIRWQTLTETNNDFFTLERSRDAETWEELAYVKGAGNSQETLSYQEIDRQPFLETSYYRLKQTDFNGEFSYSSIVDIYVDPGKLMPLDLYPNPTGGPLSIEGAPDELTSFTFYDVTGKDVTAQVKLIERTEFLIRVDISKLPRGVYLLKTENETRKVEKN